MMRYEIPEWKNGSRGYVSKIEDRGAKIEIEHPSGRRTEIYLGRDQLGALARILNWIILDEHLNTSTSEADEGWSHDDLWRYYHEQEEQAIIEEENGT